MRPEKLRVFDSHPGADFIGSDATLETVAYHGSESHLFLRTRAGVQLAATIQNSSRSSSRFAVGDRHWVGWAAGDTLVLPD